MIGVLILIALKYIDWRIPLMYLLTTVVLVVVLGDPLAYVFTGSYLLGVFFIATETSTSPVTKNGRLLYVITSYSIHYTKLYELFFNGNRLISAIAFCFIFFESA